MENNECHYVDYDLVLNMGSVRELVLIVLVKLIL